LEEANVGIKGELIHGVDEGEVVDDKEELGGTFGQFFIVLPGEVNLFHLENR
jgi:hypothetical protein